MPQFNTEVITEVDVEVEVSVKDFFMEMDSEDIKQMINFIYSGIGDYPASINGIQAIMLSSQEFLKELAYQLKYVNSENLEFLKEELSLS